MLTLAISLRHWRLWLIANSNGGRLGKPRDSEHKKTSRYKQYKYYNVFTTFKKSLKIKITMNVKNIHLIVVLEFHDYVIA